MMFNSFAFMIASLSLALLTLVEVLALFVWGPAKGKPKELKDDLLRIFRSLTEKEKNPVRQV